MRKYQILLIAILSSFLTLFVIAGLMLFFGEAIAAPAPQVTTPTAVDTPKYMSVSSLVFEPIAPDVGYTKNTARQLLTLSSQPSNLAASNNLFIAPLTLPDQTLLMGMTVFGEDFDTQGAVRVRLKRCDHEQARCLSLAEPTSTDAFALGPFETVKVTNLNERVNNNLHTYFLELELTTPSNSGLRSVRLEWLDSGGATAPVGDAKQWSLTGTVTNFLLPNSGLTQVHVCTNDLSHLPNTTHYPLLVVDGQSMRLSSNNCLTVWGRNMEIRREFNTGPSSGTYQFLR